MLLSFDLSGADWVTTAFCCRDPAMLEVARSKQSPHPITGSRITGLTVDQVMAEHKLIGNKIDPIEIADLRRTHLPDIVSQATFLPRTMSIRQMAKKANHGLNFRLGYKSFALRNEMDERDALKVVDLYRKKAYPGLLRWYNELDEQIRKTRTLENCFGRKVYFSGAMNDDTFREATAFIPQSTTFDVCGRAMQLYMRDDSAAFTPAFLLMQVHDSLVFDYRSHDFSIMAEFCRKLALDYMSPTLCYHGENYTLDVSMKAGMTWGSLKEIDLHNNLENTLHGQISAKATPAAPAAVIAAAAVV